ATVLHSLSLHDALPILEWLADARGVGSVRWASDGACRLESRSGAVLETVDVIEVKLWPPAGWKPESERLQFALSLVPDFLLPSRSEAHTSELQSLAYLV